MHRAMTNQEARVREQIVEFGIRQTFHRLIAENDALIYFSLPADLSPELAHIITGERF